MINNKFIMQEKMKKHAAFGIIINLMAMIFFGLYPIQFYKHWDTAKVSPSTRLATDEEFLHLVFYQTYPVAAIVMMLSLIIIWKLRK